MKRSRLWFSVSNQRGQRTVLGSARGRGRVSRREYGWRTVAGAGAFALALAYLPAALQSQQTVRLDGSGMHLPEMAPLSDAVSTVVDGAHQALRRLTGDEVAHDVASLVSSAERLSVRVHGHPTLSGDYNVNGDDTLAIPMVGRIVIKGLTLAALEKQLRTEVLRLTGREASVTVDVIAYREVFLTGFVNRAGAFPWKRGMTVQHAVSLSGGVFRPTTSSGSTMVADTERFRARRAAADLGRNLMTIERLKAERANQRTFKVSSEARALLDAADAAAFEAAQLAVLDGRLNAATLRTSTLKRNAAVAGEELTALMKQRDSIEVTLLKRRPRLAKLEAMRKKGIVTEDRLQVEEGRLSELEDRAASVGVSIARLKSTVLEAEHSVETFESERRAEIELELQRLSRDNALLEVEYESAQETFSALTGTQPLNAQGSLDGSTSVLSYQITRHENGRNRTITVADDAFIHPGDLIRVELKAGS